MQQRGVVYILGIISEELSTAVSRGIEFGTGARSKRGKAFVLLNPRLQYLNLNPIKN